MPSRVGAMSAWQPVYALIREIIFTVLFVQFHLGLIACTLFLPPSPPLSIGTVPAEPETVISRAWVQSPDSAE